MPHASGLSPLDDASTSRLPRAVARAAARWMTRLHSGETTAAQRDALALWRGADPLHELAWQRAERLHQALGRLPPALGVQVLDRPRRTGSRRTVVRTLAVLAVAAPTAYLAQRGAPPAQAGWTAAYRTATGARSSVVLPDGTRVQLNTDTAIDVAFQTGDAGLRLVSLRRGEVQIETSHDAQGRPFVVQTRHGRIRALGTGFVVRQLPTEGGTRVVVQHGAVEVQPAHAGLAAAIVQGGRQARLDATGIHPMAAVEPQVAAWTRGLLFASNQRLADFVAELGRYRPGVLRCAPEVAGLRISGVFRLDDTDAILAALPDTLPVRVVRRTRWWVGITAPPAR